MRLAIALASLLLCAGCASGGRQMAAGPPPDPQTLMPALENRIYELVAQERQKLDPKAKALALDSELVGVARQKSADMASRNYLGDKAPDGSQTAAGIIMDKDASFQGLLGENIAAQHYLKDYALDVDAYARRFVETWLASTGHRENLAYPIYDRTGVGAAVNGDTVYVTELFASDLGLPPAPVGAGHASAAPAGDASQKTLPGER